MRPIGSNTAARTRYQHSSSNCTDTLLVNCTNNRSLYIHRNPPFTMGTKNPKISQLPVMCVYIYGEGVCIQNSMRMEQGARSLFLFGWQSIMCVYTFLNSFFSFQPLFLSQLLLHVVLYLTHSHSYQGVSVVGIGSSAWAGLYLDSLHKVSGYMHIYLHCTPLYWVKAQKRLPRRVDDGTYILTYTHTPTTPGAHW